MLHAMGMVEPQLFASAGEMYGRVKCMGRWRSPVVAGVLLGVDDECSQSARSTHIVVDFAPGSLNRLLYLGEGTTAQG